MPLQERADGRRRTVASRRFRFVACDVAAPFIEPPGGPIGAPKPQTADGETAHGPQDRRQRMARHQGHRPIADPQRREDLVQQQDDRRDAGLGVPVPSVARGPSRVPERS